jgi:hypothetical protein
MSEVQVGDKVLAMGPDGKPFFDEMYLVPHKDSQAHKDSQTQYLTLTSDITSDTQQQQALTLSPQHYLEVLCETANGAGDAKGVVSRNAGAGAGRCLRKASQVVPGDKIWVRSDESEEIILATITKVSHVTVTC